MARLGDGQSVALTAKLLAGLAICAPGYIVSTVSAGSPVLRGACKARVDPDRNL